MNDNQHAPAELIIAAAALGFESLMDSADQYFGTELTDPDFEDAKAHFDFMIMHVARAPQQVLETILATLATLAAAAPEQDAKRADLLNALRAAPRAARP
jgi:hypothetical protein